MSIKRLYALKCLAMVVALLSLGMGMAVGQEQSQSEIDRIRLQQEKEAAESEKRAAIIRTRPWYKNFTPEDFVPGEDTYHEGHKDFDSYVNSQCENFVKPQFKKSDTPEEAVHQLETLMGQLGALYSFQEYIHAGQIGYTFATLGEPLNNDNLTRLDSYIMMMFDYHRDKIPFSHPEMVGELKDLKDKFSPNYPTDFVLVSDHEAKILFNVEGAAKLGRLEKSPELQSPPRYLKKILESRDPELERMRLPSLWNFTEIERRDKFNYTYLYPLKSVEHKGQYIQLSFNFSAKRGKDRSLSDVTLDSLYCAIPSNMPKGMIPAGNGVRPTVPDLVVNCDEHKKWYEKNLKKNACFQHGYCKAAIDATYWCMESK